MTGEKHELFIKIMEVLIQWEGNLKRIPEQTDVVFNRFNSHLLHNTQLSPAKNLREIINCLKIFSLEELGFGLTENLRNRFIITEEGLLDLEIKEWYELEVNKDDIDQELVREFLIQCRKIYKRTKDSSIEEMYTDIRSFINPQNHYITYNEIIRLLSKYSDYSMIVSLLKKFYEPIKINEEVINVCPICGKLSSNALFKEDRCTSMCMYYRDEQSLALKEFKITENSKYFKLKNGIYIYTLLPGIAENRIYRHLIEEFPEKEVRLYPKIDKFDISIKIEDMYIFIDIKDVESPHHLIKLLQESRFIQKSEEFTRKDKVILVIPQHRKFLYQAGDYKSIVKRNVTKISKGILVCYENEFFKKMKEIIYEY